MTLTGRVLATLFAMVVAGGAVAGDDSSAEKDILRVEAELLRDLPGVGLLLSKILWPVTKIFEYEVTGTLGDLKAEPLYMIPKILLFPLQPLKILKEIVTPAPVPPPPKPPQ